ncbi:hypothetical protein EDB86DRAFT_400918 [Lactarius hatsudake]|nr:hypothetical protein EDB86DRAFT_400918 [Lactarius hatsudake]
MTTVSNCSLLVGCFGSDHSFGAVWPQCLLVFCVRLALKCSNPACYLNGLNADPMVGSRLYRLHLLYGLLTLRIWNIVPSSAQLSRQTSGTAFSYWSDLDCANISRYDNQFRFFNSIDVRLRIRTRAQWNMWHTNYSKLNRDWIIYTEVPPTWFIYRVIH